MKAELVIVPRWKASIAPVILVIFALVGVPVGYHVYGEARHRSRLRALRPGMTADQVSAILGKLRRTDPREGEWIVSWPCCGRWTEVRFDRNGRLIGYHEDRF